MTIRSWLRISTNFLLFPLLYPWKKSYPSLGEHFAIRDQIPAQADYVIALGCSLRADGTAANPTRAIADRAAEIYKGKMAKRVILSGGNPVNGISEGEAMRRVLEKSHGLAGPDILLDPLPLDKYIGTADQVKSIAGIFKRAWPQKVILVVHPQQLPRACVLFRSIFPEIEFFPANPAEEYDALSQQTRMHSAFNFKMWNCVAWAGIWRSPIGLEIKKD